MTSYEIYWDDLNEEAKERLKSLYHENIDLSPLAIVDQEDEGKEECYRECERKDYKIDDNK